MGYLSPKLNNKSKNLCLTIFPHKKPKQFYFLEGAGA